MTKLAVIIASILAGLTANVSAAESLRSRVFPSCGYVGKQIYCCGGDMAVADSNYDTIDMNLYALNVSQFIGRPSDSMSSQWNKITYTSPFSIEARRTPTSAVLSDGVRFLINGGHNMYGNKLTNQTIVYDTTANTWTKATSYVVQGLGTRQIYYSTAVNLPNNLVGFFGGLEQVANASVPFITTTGEVMALDDNNGSYVGFHRLTMITAGANVWSDYTPQSTPLANFFPNSQSATINPATGRIYYLGGSYYYPSNTYPTRVPFNWAAVFDSKSGAWLNETLTGVIPTERIYHSATLMPNSQDLLLYGGSNDGQAASTDYCFTLNLQTNEWVNQDNLNVPSYLSGPRYAHSAVLVDTTLFILFGKGLDGTLNPSLLTIDIGDVKNITYTPIYHGAADTSNDAGNSGTNNGGSGGSNGNIDGTPGESSTNGKSDGLSKGAVGGIAAGCVIVGLGLIAFLFFYLRRQKKNKQQEHEDDNVQESMHVDWDRIEGHYKEVPITVNSNSPQFTESPNLTGHTTLVSSSVIHHSPNLVDENVTVTRNKNPDVANDIVKPSTHLTGDYTIVKPDGSN